MPAATSVSAVVVEFPTLSLPKHMVKIDYTSIKEIRQLLMLNEALVYSTLGGVYNGYLVCVLPPYQYARLAVNPFKCPAEPRRTATKPAWTLPGEEN